MQSNLDAFLDYSQKISTMYYRYRGGNRWKQYCGDDLVNTVGFAMSYSPDENLIKEGASNPGVVFRGKALESINSVVEAIRDYGGINPEIIIYPVVLWVKTGKVMDAVVVAPLFCTRKWNDKDSFQYIDTACRRYKGKQDFINNEKYPPGKISYAENLHFTENSKGDVVVRHCDTEASSGVAKFFKALDITSAIAGIGLAALSLTGVGLPFVIGGGAILAIYGVGRSVNTLGDRSDHGQSIDPFSSMEAFFAWAGIATTVMNFATAAVAAKMSASISLAAVEGVREATAGMRAGMAACIAVPMVINGTVMTIQLGLVAENWERVPPTQKIILGLQLLFFIGATFSQVQNMSPAAIIRRAQQHGLTKIRTELAKGPGSDAQVAAFDILVNNAEHPADVLNYFKTVLGTETGARVFLFDMDKKLTAFGEIYHKKVDGELVRQYGSLIQLGPEGSAQLAAENMKDFKGALVESGAGSSYGSSQAVPAKELTNVLRAARMKTNSEIASALSYTQTAIVPFCKNNVHFFQDVENLLFHEKCRLAALMNTSKQMSLVEKQLAIDYAVSKNPNTTSQFISHFEIADMAIHEHKRVIRQQLLSRGQKMGLEPSNLLRKNESDSSLLKQAENMIRGYLRDKKAAETLCANWLADSSESKRQFVKLDSNDTAFERGMAIQDLSKKGYLKFEYKARHVFNCAKLLINGDGEYSPNKLVEEANETIRCSLPHQIIKCPPARNDDTMTCFAFWDTRDPNITKSTVVGIGNSDGQCNIVSFTVKRNDSNNKQIRGGDDWVQKAIDDELKSSGVSFSEIEEAVTYLLSVVKDEFVGSQFVQPWKTHDQTVPDLIQLAAAKKIRFAGEIQAVCHIVKHGHYGKTLHFSEMSNSELNKAAIDYFNRAQEIIQSTESNPDFVSSSWSQTGGSRDFTFYRKEEGKPYEMVVVLVKKSGEVILKTYYRANDPNTNVPVQKKHVNIAPFDTGSFDDLFSFFLYLNTIQSSRYGVLLPNEYEVKYSNMAPEVNRKILTIFGSCMYKDGSLNASNCQEALDEMLPFKGEKWNVVSGNNLYWSIRYTGDRYFSCSVGGKDVIAWIRSQAKSIEAIDRSAMRKSVVENRQKLWELYPRCRAYNLMEIISIQTTRMNNDDATVATAIIYLSDQDTAKMRDLAQQCFGGEWNAVASKEGIYFQVFHASECFIYCSRRQFGSDLKLLEIVLFR